MNNENKELSEELLESVAGGGGAGVMYKGYLVIGMRLVGKQYCPHCEFDVHAFLDEKANRFDAICTECQQKIGELPFK